MLSEAFVNKLHNMWRNDHSMDTISSEILSELAIRSFSSRVLLYGSEIQEGKYFEQMVGTLTAFAPGVVLVNNQDRALCGLLNKTDDPQCSLYSLDSFSDYGGITIQSTTAKGWQRRVDPACPICLYWQIGAGQAESYNWLGIDEKRWELLEKWLKEWLP